MKVFLTGGSGFIGKVTGELLHREGYEVFAIARSAAAAGKVEAWGGTVVEGDITTPGEWQERLRACDAVVHAAASVGDWSKTEEYWSVNVEGTRLVAETALGQVGKFVHVSSIAAYGGPGEYDESAPPRHGRHPYTTTKAVAEEVVDEAIAKGLHAVHARVGNVYGPGDPNFMPRLIEQAKTGRFPVIGDGSQPSNLIHVDDVASALVAMLKVDTEPGERFLVVDPETPSMREAVEFAIEAIGLETSIIRVPKGIGLVAAVVSELFAKVTGRRPAITLYAVRGMGAVRIFHNEQTMERLSWRPRYTLREGIAATAASFLE
ncbi:NAD-dependent epimerase/dehydratase family protein [Gemmatimonadota bacterium]